MARTDNIKNAVTNFKGIYDVTSISPQITYCGKVALTRFNDVIFLGNIESVQVPITQGTTLFVLPEECRPHERIHMLLSDIVKTSPNTNNTFYLNIYPDGRVTNGTALASTGLHWCFTNGRSFNISGKYYG